LLIFKLLEELALKQLLLKLFVIRFHLWGPFKKIWEENRRVRNVFCWFI